MIWGMRIGAIVLILIGLVWLGQGLNLLPGSVMSGQLFWAIVGFLCVVGGAFLGYRSMSASTRPPG